MFLTGLLCAAGIAAATERPNILLITVDDMNADSVGAFGSRVEETTPQIDRLAAQGIRFEHAHMQVANCSPSRNVLQTGQYPHNNEVEGFYDVTPSYPILPDLLKANGYLTGIWGKVSDSTPLSHYEWDEVIELQGPGHLIKDAEAVKQATAGFIDRSRAKERPFYLVMNISDPHHPLFASEASAKRGFDRHSPSRIYRPGEIRVPGFLPDTPVIREELAAYFSSVRRADDITGAILEAIDEAGLAASTLVIFLSDHGMPFPFAKTNLYHHSTRSPWILRLPGFIEPGTVDSRHMISAIDFMPTILDYLRIAHPDVVDGTSFLPLLKGEAQSGRDKVFKEFHETAGGIRNPMRSVETLQYGYIFNPWSDGERLFKSATLYSRSYKAMKQAAQTDPAVAARLAHFNHRTVEELYDYRKDPDGLDNLINDPAHAEVANQLRAALEDWMRKTGDPALQVFQNRQSLESRHAFLATQEAKSRLMNSTDLGRKR